MNKQLLNPAAKYAVASELCRRNIRPNLIFGSQGKIELWIAASHHQQIRIDVRAKQRDVWPASKGISVPDRFVILVDYEYCNLEQRPDFYVLSAYDWHNVLEKRVDEIRARDPEKQVEVTQENIAVFKDERVTSTGEPWRGVDIRRNQVEEFQDAWTQIEHT